MVEIMWILYLYKLLVQRQIHLTEHPILHTSQLTGSSFYVYYLNPYFSFSPHRYLVLNVRVLVKFHKYFYTIFLGLKTVFNLGKVVVSAPLHNTWYFGRYTISDCTQRTKGAGIAQSV
jgi:hypothetical protein